MKRQFFAACALLFVGACAGLNGTDDYTSSNTAGGEYNADGVFVAYCSGEPAPVIYTKEGFPIIDDQACIPEPEVLGITVVNTQRRTTSHRPDKPYNPHLPPTCEQLNNCPPPPPPPPPSQVCEGDLVGNFPACSCPNGQISTGGNSCEFPPPPPPPLVCTGDLVGEYPACSCPDGQISTGGDSCGFPPPPPTCAELGQYDNGNSCEPWAVCDPLLEDLDASTNSCDPISCANNEVLIGGICIPKNQCNSGGGNGPEGVPIDCDPGNSGDNNNGDD